MKERLFLYTIIALLGASFLGYVVFDKTHHPHKITQKAPKIALPTVKINPQNFILKQPFAGTVTAIENVDIIPYVTGYIDKILVKGGENVQKNTPLFTISPHIYQAQVDQFKAQVNASTADFENAKIYLERLQKTPQNAISKTELDNAKATFLSYKANLNAVKAQLALAEINYNYTTIKSPIAGVVGNIATSVGAYVSANGAPLTSIIKQSPIRVAFSMTNAQYLDLLAQNPQNPFKNWQVALKLPNGQKYDDLGRVEYVDNHIQNNTSSITVYARFLNLKGALINNGYVDVFLQKEIKNGILLEKSAVHLAPKSSFVYVQTKKGIVKQNVTIGGDKNNDYFITSGLKANDKVITGTVPGFMLKK